MLKKLFKYDIHFQIKRVLPLYLITLAWHWHFVVCSFYLKS
ncbi:hypothetical protein [Amedibacillus dolichus]|nr:hypothetical protein [Amedibacillus dolichus]